MKGNCLCNAVTVEAADVDHFEACHCGMCRRWGGGPFLSVHGNNAVFSGEDSISTFPSSEWAERGFCTKCGTHLFYRLKQTGEYALSLGLFPDKQDFVFSEQIFIDRKPDFYEFANETKNSTEQEIFEKFGA